MATQPPRDRLAARVLLIDGAERVLLFRGCDPATPQDRFWFTVGGGLEDGEGFPEAAARELFEETGLRLSAHELHGPVTRDVAEFPYDGHIYQQRQEFFAAVVDSWRVDESGFEKEEARAIDAHRWWTRAELAGTADAYYPENLIELLDRVLALGLPTLQSVRVTEV